MKNYKDELDHNIEKVISEYKSLLKLFSGNDYDFSGIQIPRTPEVPARLVIIPRNLTVFDILDWYQNHAEIQLNHLIDLEQIYNEGMDARKSSSRGYAIWVKDDVEPDKETIGLPTVYSSTGITLSERLIDGLVYFRKRQRHLDEMGRTICSGTQLKNNLLPAVHYSGNAIEIVAIKSGQSLPFWGERSILI